MNHTYFDTNHGATVDLIQIRPYAWLVTRVEVRSEWRGQGHGGRLLDRVCMVADAEHIDLLLSVEPDGTGLDHEALIGFYERRGFVLLLDHSDSAMIRRRRRNRDPRVLLGDPTQPPDRPQATP